MVEFSRIILVEQEICQIDDSQLRSLLKRADLFSSYEQNYCCSKPTPLLSVAGLWCAKRALVKATNYKLNFSNFDYLDLEIRHNANGKPTMAFKGNLANWFKEQNIGAEIAITHTNSPKQCYKYLKSRFIQNF